MSVSVCVCLCVYGGGGGGGGGIECVPCALAAIGQPARGRSVHSLYRVQGSLSAHHYSTGKW